MEFNNGAELLELCQKTGFPISQIMKKREAEFSKISEAEVEKKMRITIRGILEVYNSITKRFTKSHYGKRNVSIHIAHCQVFPSCCSLSR